MQQSLGEKHHQNHCIGLYLNLVIVSIVLYLAIGFFVSIRQNAKCFQKRVESEVTSQSIVAVMPKHQNMDKVVQYFKNQKETMEWSTKDALCFGEVDIKGNKGSQSIKLLVQKVDDTRKEELTKDALTASEVMVPYGYQVWYDWKQKDTITIGIHGKSKTVTIGGFYEDDVFRNPKDMGVLLLLVSKETYETLKTDANSIHYNTIEVKTKQNKDTLAVAKDCVRTLEDELFIDGLSLEFYTVQQSRQGILSYLTVTKLVCYALCLIVIIITFISIRMLSKAMQQKLHFYHKKLRNEVGCIFLHTILSGTIGVVLQFACMRHIIRWIIESTGYSMQYQETILLYGGCYVIYVVVCSLFLLVTSLVFKKRGQRFKCKCLKVRRGKPIIQLGKVASVKKSLETYQKKVSARDMNRAFARQTISVFFIACTLFTVCLFVTNVYMDTMKEERCSNRVKSQDVMEVFQPIHPEDTKQEICEWDTIHEMAKPLVTFTVLVMIVSCGIAIHTVLLYVITQRLVRFRGQNGERLLYREHTLTMLFSVGGIVLFAYVIAEFLARNVCVKIVANIFASYQIILPKISWNVTYGMVIVFGVLLLTGGITVTEVR